VASGRVTSVEPFGRIRVTRPEIARSGHEAQSKDLLKRTFNSALERLICDQGLTVSIGAN
jgi:hypothetical protein